MKSQFIKTAYAVTFLMFLFVGKSFAVTTWTWKGGTAANPTDWATGGNWTHTGTTPTDTYPGKTASSVNDIVQIGVSTTFSSLPIISSATTVKFASLTFGSNGATPGNEGFQALTIYGTLTVTGTITQNPGTIGAKNAGGNCGSIAGTINLVSITIMTGTGTVNCNSIQVGNATTPANANVINYIIFKIASFDPNVSTLTVNVTTDFLVESASSVVGGKISSNNDAICSFSAGTLTVGGTIKLINNGKTLTTTVPCDNYLPFANFSVDLNDTHLTPADNPVLILKGANPVSIPADFNTGDVFDFYNNAGGAGVATINYAGTGATQEVYSYNGSNASFVHFDQDGPVAGDQQGVYDNLVFSGSGNKTVDAGTFSVAGNFTLLNTVTSPAVPESVLLNTNNPTTTITGNYSTATGTVLTSGTGTITISGTSYANSGTSTFGSGLVTFNATATTAFTGTGTSTFTNVTFNGNNTNNMTAGTYNVISTGVLTLSGTTTKLNAGGDLTLVSDVNGSATVAKIPSGCSIGGNVNVQRYISGGVGSRGYRLLSSPVNTGTVDPDGTGNTIFSLNYLMASSFQSGTTGAAGGFDASPLNNPSLYLYRENLSPLNTSFLNSNYRGVMDLNNNPGYHFNSDAVNIESPGLRYLPIGNGFLMYFRGSRATPTPFVAGSLALAATLTATGALNQGNITVADWYTPGSPNLGYTTSSGSATIEGANLVGNPYPAAIDWSTYSATSTGAGIYAPNVGPFIYMLLPGNKAGAGNYAIWSKTTTPTNGATSIIASGEGFFVYALPPTVTNPTSSITFTEGAKVNTSPGPATFLAKIPASARVPVAVPQYLLLKAALDSINSDEMLINFRNDAKAAYDPMEDARYKTGTGKVNLGSISSDNVALAINSMPLAPKGQTIPLKINASATGTYTLNTEEIKNIPQLYDVWLKDAYTKDSVDMRKTPSYSFTITLADTNSFGAKRFSIVINPNPALAYKLTSFTASQVINKEQVQLAWKTANEQNTTQFAVERSTDLGKTFDTLNTKTSDDSGSYSFLDQEPNSDNLYRLRQQDVTGNVTRSSVLEVLITDRPQDAVSINVYPNPVVSNLTLTIKPRVVETNVTYRIKVSNSSGLVVKQVITPNTSWQDNISNLQLGTYLVQVLNNSDNSVVGETKFVKL